MNKNNNFPVETANARLHGLTARTIIRSQRPSNYVGANLGCQT